MIKHFFILIFLSACVSFCSSNNSDSKREYKFHEHESGRMSISHTMRKSENPLVNELYDEGILHIKRENYILAKSYFLKIYSIEPTNVYVLNVLGNIEMRFENFEKSEKYLRKAIEIEPNFPFSYINLGLSLFYADEFEEAISVLKSMDYSRADDVTLATNYFHLFMNYTLLGECDTAYYYYQSSIELKSNDRLERKNIEEFKKEVFEFICCC